MVLIFLEKIALKSSFLRALMDRANISLSHWEIVTERLRAVALAILILVSSYFLKTSHSFLKRRLKQALEKISVKKSTTMTRKVLRNPFDFFVKHPLLYGCGKTIYVKKGRTYILKPLQRKLRRAGTRVFCLATQSFSQPVVEEDAVNWGAATWEEENGNDEGCSIALNADIIGCLSTGKFGTSPCLIFSYCHNWWYCISLGIRQSSQHACLKDTMRNGMASL